MGYEIGSGVMIGIPGQSYEDLARDIQWFSELDLDMIGVGPFLPHPATPLGEEDLATTTADQVPSSEGMTYKVIALSRLVCPRANIPSTTALATLNRVRGRELGLARGANVVMPNLTPPEYRALYEIYPDKACVRETADACHTCLGVRIASIGRRVGQGRGDSPNFREKGTGPFCRREKREKEARKGDRTLLPDRPPHLRQLSRRTALRLSPFLRSCKLDLSPVPQSHNDPNSQFPGCLGLPQYLYLGIIRANVRGCWIALGKSRSRSVGSRQAACGKQWCPSSTESGSESVTGINSCRRTPRRKWRKMPSNDSTWKTPSCVE